MRLAAAIALALLAPSSALAGTVTGSGGAAAPPRPDTGGALAVQVSPPPPEARPVRPRPSEPTAAPAAARRSPVASERVTQPDVAAAGEAIVAQRDRDEPDVPIEVPVPGDAGPSAAPAAAPAGTTGSLPRAGLEVIPLALLGLALMVAGLTALRLVTRPRG